MRIQIRLSITHQIIGTDNYNELTEYATIRRYENGIFELDSEDLARAVAVAEQFLIWAKQITQYK